MKKLLKNNLFTSLLIILLLCAFYISSSYAITTVPVGYKFVAQKSAAAKVYHNVNCPTAKNINDTDAIFFKTATQALQQGYQPDPKCIKTATSNTPKAGCHTKDKF